MERIQPQNILLRPLTDLEAAGFYALYDHPDVNGGESPFLKEETAVNFLHRIQSLCERHYGIFRPEDPGTLIGDCALHHWNPNERSMEIGGALLPEFQGLGMMRSAFQQLIGTAKAEFGAACLYGRTLPGNQAAIKLVTGLGFTGIGDENGETVLRLLLN